MAIALEQFVKQLEESGILAGDMIKDFIPPKASPKDTQELARELVRRKKLTKFQAEEVYKGNASSLVLGNYVLMEKIGAGGMGQVFRAEHRRMKRIVAIKLLPPSMTKDKASIARFEREVEAAAKISHPNIVAAFDADCANGVHFLVMELVEGSDLSALVKKQGPFSVAVALKCIIQAAKGLEAAHRKGIVHRDIKPANLLLDNEGTVKILDMGLARLINVSDAAVQAELTSSGTIMGTIDYMAPEQALDTRTADARADIYALGCSLHYLLTGKAVYQGDSVMKKLLAHRDQPIPALRGRRPEATGHLEAVFTRMVAKKAEERYQTATQLLLDLEKCELETKAAVASHQTKKQLIQTAGQQALCNIEQGDPAEAQTVISESLVESSGEPSLSNFLTELSGDPHPRDAKKTVKSSREIHDPVKWLKIATGLLAFFFVLGILVVKLKTKDGMLIVTVNEPDSEVQVLNEEGKVEITRKGETGPITISVDPGKHRIKVTKDGFSIFGQDFEIEEGGRHPITAKLMPLDAPHAMEQSNSQPALSKTTPNTVAAPKMTLAFEMPGFDQWASTVTALPVPQQVEAVSKKLVELNPEFDGIVSHRVENGAVTDLHFSLEKITDLSPVRALRGLKVLIREGMFGAYSELSDLSPLRGMSLISLNCSRSKVTDLTPLQGMKLKILELAETPVSDLSPLTDLPLTSLNCNLTHVSDLRPLKNAPLKTLSMFRTHVTDLNPLKGHQLAALSIHSTNVSDLSALKGMPLTHLYAYGTKARDYSPIKDLPLTILSINIRSEADLSLLRSIRTLEKINDKATAEFWKEVEASKR